MGFIDTVVAHWFDDDWDIIKEIINWSKSAVKRLMKEAAELSTPTADYQVSRSRSLK